MTRYKIAKNKVGNKYHSLCFDYFLLRSRHLERVAKDLIEDLYEDSSDIKSLLSSEWQQIVQMIKLIT